MQIFLRDLRYGARKLLKTPGATLIAIMTLALGIGANTAIFSLIDAVLLRMLPVNAPQQLVFLSNPNRHGVNGGQESGDRRLFAYHEFEWLRDHNQVFSGIFAVDSRIITRSVSIEGGTGGNRADETTPATISRVSGSYFQVLGVSALLGRTFIEEIEIAKNAGPVAVMSYSYWKNRLGRDPNVIGRKLRIDQTTFDIIGIMPPGFFGETVGEAPGIWVPLTALTEKDLLSPPGDVRNKYMWLQVAARLKSGVSLEQAQAGINMGLQQLLHSEAGQLSKAARPEYLNQRIVLAAGGRGASTLRAPFGEPLLILMGLVGLVLAIACANVATLSLARGTTRQKEIAICIALGISRRYLIRQLLTESALLALVGGTAGLLLAQWMDVLLLRLFSSGAGPIPLDLQPDVRMLGFTLGISILTGLLCGLVPAFRAGRVDLQLALKGKTKGFTGSVFQRGRIPVGKILVIGQIALSLILSLVAGLFVQSFQKLARVDLGYDGDHLLQFSLFPKPDDYQGRFDQLQRELIERIRAIPGVRGASVSLSGLFTGMNFDMKVSVEGHLPVPDRQMSAANDYVGPNYFSSIGIPVLVGREIGPQDEGNAPLVGVINQTMARSFFGGSTPIGRRIKAVAEYGTLDFVIVGVVADSQQDSLRAGPASWFYTPFFHASRHPNFTWAINGGSSLRQFRRGCCGDSCYRQRCSSSAGHT